MQHSCVNSDKPVHVQHLLVNGCGGAFLHPTHIFKHFNTFCENSYKSEVTYPSFDDSSRVSSTLLILLPIEKILEDQCWHLPNSFYRGLFFQIALGNILPGTGFS
ncbi:uncharacterized protein A4U43_C03F28690 [Asparagus officinalis]|uniref:Uncharacterized protein n=1 Tax=Asparagus officinalis TaxID=4686 RepID=A0A5P1FGG7_ASPOF|nr:uncharacterized protein A4U43_C03F28690 [Asparagus officinalis]